MATALRRLFGHHKAVVRPAAVPVVPNSDASGTWFEAKRKRFPTVGLPREFLHRGQVIQRFQPLLDEREVVEAIQQDEVPIPATADREGYFGDRHLEYWLSGRFDLREVQRLIPEVSLAHVLDFGGATGRFSRHVAQTHPSATVTIADLSHNHVLWCGEHLGPSVRAVKVSEYCHFPLRDESVSLCVGLSVFTHIDRFETGWLAEIQRVLQPAAHAYLTIHSEDTWQRMSWMTGIANMQKDPEFTAFYAANPKLPNERVVIDHQPGTRFHVCNTFVHSDYVRRVWGKWFDIVGIYPGIHHDWQTVVVLRKPDATQ